MTNGLNIENEHQFSELFEKDQGLAMGLVFTNMSSMKSDISEMKDQCNCRYEQCQDQMRQNRKKDRAKNISIQFCGGILGGIATAWVFIKSYVEQVISK